MLCDLTTCYSMESAWLQRLSLKYDQLLSHLACNINLRHYTEVFATNAANKVDNRARTLKGMVLMLGGWMVLVVGPGRYRPPRHSTCFELSFLCSIGVKVLADMPATSSNES